MYLGQMIRHYNDPVVVDGMHRHDSWANAVLTLLIVLIVAGVAIYLIRAIAQNNRNNQTLTDVRDPLDIAKERYAKGEITKEELSEIKAELK